MTTSTPVWYIVHTKGPDELYFNYENRRPGPHYGTGGRAGYYDDYGNAEARAGLLQVSTLRFPLLSTVISLLARQVLLLTTR